MTRLDPPVCADVPPVERLAARVIREHEPRPWGCACGAQIGDDIDRRWHLVNQAIAAATEQAKPCPKCLGEKLIADSDDGEPWSVWANLPPGSDLAVCIGLVKPITCPECKGAGVKS